VFGLTSPISSGVSYAAEVIDQRVERRLEVPRAPGRAKHLDAALDARDEGRRDPSGVQLRADEARGLHLGDALDEVRLPLREESSDDLGRARRAADLGHERAKRAVPSLGPVTGHDGVPPAIPRGPGGEAAEVRLLVVEDALRLVPRGLKQQFLLARREVVEDLALARAGDGPDVVQRRLAREVAAQVLRCALDDALPGSPPLRSKCHVATVPIMDLTVQTG